MFVIPTGPGLPCGPVIPTGPAVPVGSNVILLFIISKKFRRIELLLLKKIHLY